MNAYTEALIREIAPVIQKLVTSEVHRQVDEKLAARDLVVAIWRGPWTPGAYGIGDVVESAGRMFRATAATTQVPTTEAADWTLVADREH